MEVFSDFSASDSHKDLIHDIAYDYYGKRLATCSSDLMICIWSQQGADEKWKLENTFNPGHQNPVSRISWAHPEFGQVIASCSHDRTIRIHEEQVRAGHDIQWKRVASLSDSRDVVEDLKFAPRYQGLRIASASMDGFIRIYESTDMLDLSVWEQWTEFSPSPQTNPPQLPQGADSPSDPGLAVSCHCLSWNPSAYDPPMMAVGARIGDKHVVQIWEYTQKHRKWQMVAEIDGYKEQVRDVHWAPDMGRGFHLIASACTSVKIFKLRYNRDREEYDVKSLHVADDVDTDQEVWRVKWNLTGTVLASTGDDGKAKLWKKGRREDGEEAWQCTLVAKWKK